MSNKASFESRIMDFFTNASYERVDITYGLIKEIFKRRKAAHTEEAAKVSSISDNPTPKVRKKRRTKALTSSNTVEASTPPSTAASASASA